MGRMAGPELAGFEEHLLVCIACQDRLAREDSFRQTVRDAGAALSKPRKPILARFPKLAWGAGLAAALVLVLAGIAWQAGRHPNVRPVAILLQTTRGADGVSQTAPAGAPLTLVLDLTDLPQFPSYEVEVVDSVGHPMARSQATPHAGRLEKALDKPLPSGAYYVRLYSPTRELLREYALIVRA